MFGYQRVKLYSEFDVALKILVIHCVKSVHIHSFPGLYFPTFGLNTEIYYRVNLCIESKCGKIRTRKATNTVTFQDKMMGCVIYTMDPG